MKIRVKMFLVVLPLVIVTLCLSAAASYFQAVNGVTRIARQFLGFKASELEKYADNQWSLLVENNYAGRSDMVNAAKQAVEIYAKSIILSDTEIILALDKTGALVMASSPLEILPEEKEALLRLLEEEKSGILNAVMGGEKRVVKAFHFTPFQWDFLLTETNSAFYQDAERIAFQTMITLGVSVAAALLLLVLVTARLTKPLSRVVGAMNNIIDKADLSSRVEVAYSDETGQLAHTFNIMTGELDKAYKQIKRYAFEAVLAGKKEQRIRQIFQKYVPKDLIDKFFAAPESMLVGDNRVLAVLFSDIRSFTTISENMAPDDLVNSLNRYFSGQVDIIMNRNGIVDKYIGDAIMAFWGAPVKHEDDALQSVLSGLDMLDALEGFNANQRNIGKPEFHIGIGINYGIVTVGNIGSERKMDYTVIGDMVNLASRLEGLTKTYHAGILISEGLYAELQNQLREKAESGAGQSGAPRLYFRLLDTVAVKGKKVGVKIYTVKRALSPHEEKAWPIHNEGMELYYRRSFREAALKFKEVCSIIPRDADGNLDYSAETLFKRCAAYVSAPPPEDWDGVEVMKTK